MCSRCIWLLLVSLLAGSALAAPGRFGPAWSSLYDAPYHLNEVQGIAVDGEGNTYVTGYSGTSFSPGQPPEPGQPVTGGVTVKYSPTGERLWVSRQMSFTDAIALDGLGGVYVAGYGTGSPERGLDYHLYKLNAATGIEIWGNSYDSPDPVPGAFRHDAAQAVVVDASGNPVVTGISTGTGQQTDIATVKYDGVTGDEIWTARFDGSASLRDAGRQIAVDPSGDVIVAGTTTGIDTLTDIVTLKYDGQTGDEIGKSIYDGPAHLNEAVAGLRVAADGGVLVAGTAQVTADDFDIVTLRYHPTTFQQQWVSLLGEVDREESASALALGPNGSLYLTGTTTHNVDSDLLTIKLDAASGTEQWVRSYDGSGRESLISGDFASDVCVDGTGNVYVVGAAVVSRTEDLLVVKYDPAGERLWASTWDARRFPDYGAACAMDSAGNLMVAGRAGYEADILGHGAFATLKYRSDGIVGPTVRPARNAPRITLSETLRERLVSRREGGQTVVGEVRSGTFTATFDVPLTGVDPANLGGDTLFALRLGDLYFLRQLFDDPRYRQGKSSATFSVNGPNAQNRTVKLLTVTLNMARGRLRVTVRSTASYAEQLLARPFIDVESGMASGTTVAYIELGTFRQSFELSYVGRVTTNPSRDDRFLLSNVQLRAAGPITPVPTAPLP